MANNGGVHVVFILCLVLAIIVHPIEGHDGQPSPQGLQPGGRHKDIYGMMDPCKFKCFVECDKLSWNWEKVKCYASCNWGFRFCKN
ncbi:hypothetical protein FRX31_005887 [Thalictrum thalictroides]|uniref:Transmembrane protein n=1 Tax=Thalictrum thalictroides TaxID=46969 RepID=A0A7J6X6Q8_THATH|nr:hypothetical protein FRX31_005887 [Thalictrum thalictroides]